MPRGADLSTLFSRLPLFVGPQLELRPAFLAIHGHHARPDCASLLARDDPPMTTTPDELTVDDYRTLILKALAAGQEARD